MISIYQLKPKFQSLLRPLVIALVKRGVSANQVTLLTCAVSILIAILVMLGIFYQQIWVWWLIPIWMTVRMAFNAIDGMMAREFKQQSTLGGFYNELTDVIADTALYAVFFAVVGVSSLLVLAFIFLAILSEYTGVMGPLVGASRRYDGPMGKSDRAFYLGVLSVFLAMDVVGANTVNVVLGVLSLLLVYTIYNRIQKAIAEVKAKQHEAA